MTAVVLLLPAIFAALFFVALLVALFARRPFCEARKDSFICNRARGHSGPHMHMAESGGKVGWRNAADPNNVSPP